MGDVLEGNETLISHLTELRKRLLNIIGIVFVGFFVAWYFSNHIFDFIRAPIEPFLPEGGLVFTAPMDKFLAHIKVSLIASIILSCPLWIYQVWLFVAPGLYKNEKKFGLSFITFGTILFLTGVSFVYYVVYPMAFNFLMLFGGETDKPMITIESYLSFFTTTTLVFGLTFEMPLILTILGMMGIIDAEFLSSKRRYAIVILALMSAMFTPPDVISMILMMIPMLLLYELSVFMVRFFAKRSKIET
ncbi:MAG: twin-arginine translocase subunit TatC [Bdellovibrionales bacterium]|nr:twin-arginine translocase subunit TatC [Bdellovibrionales bacterium]